MIEAAILDFDGTLFDSMSIWKDVANILIKNEGIIPNEKANAKTRKMSIVQASSYLKELYNLDYSTEEIINKICLIVENYYLNDVLPKSGAKEFIEYLSSKNIRQFLVSANEKYLIESCLKKYKLLDYFEAIITCTDIGLNKDDPEIFINTFKQYNLDAKNTIIFDDSLYAIRAAKKARLITVGVFDESEEEFDKAILESDYFIYNFEEAKQIIESIR